MKKLKKQEIFDKVWNWFITENHAQSVSKHSGSCAYRGSKGDKCPVGVCIPDKFYDIAMDNSMMDVEQAYEAFPKLGKVFRKKDLGFLMILQQVHDNWVYTPKKPKKFKMEKLITLTEIASYHKVEIPKE